MSLRDEIKQGLKEAMLKKDQRRVATLRLIQAAIKDRDIAARVEDKQDIDDNARIQEILSKMIKQRRDSIEAFEQAGRLELAEQEREEISIIEDFLPRQLSDDEIEEAVDAAIEKTGAGGLKDMGRVMGTLKKEYTGQMDFSKASAIVKDRLAA